jgi:DNA-binding NarL/FixJ family response regulator
MARLLVVDAYPIVRAGIKEFLGDHQEFIVAGEAGSGADAVRMVRASTWDVVLLDISLPDMKGIEALTQIKRIKPEQRVLMLTMHPEDRYALNLLRAGASGHLNKECTPKALLSAIRTVASGRRYISPVLGEQLVGRLNGEGHNAPHTELSQREFQIFCKLAGGKAVSRVADELLLSVTTVSTYRSRVLEKMNMKSNANITYYAIKHGLI